MLIEIHIHENAVDNIVWKMAAIFYFVSAPMC